MIRKRRLVPLFSGRKSADPGIVSLQITSMADIFTILLVFLLKGISSDTLTLTPSPGVRLPTGIHTTALSERALQIELSESGILVEKIPVATFPDFESDFSKRLARESSSRSDTVIILSDGRVPFATLKRVLSTLGRHGFFEVKFGVIRE